MSATCAHICNGSIHIGAFTQQKYFYGNAVVAKQTKPKGELPRTGKRRQAWTQRGLERARRGAPNRTIIIRPDGSFELPPPGQGTASEQKNPLDRVLKDAAHKDRTS